jgi:hypothetical protein
LIVTTRNIAARVSLAATDWDTGAGKLETMFDPFDIRASRTFCVTKTVSADAPIAG